MSYQILVVDDQDGLAKGVATFLSKRTGLSVVSTDDPVRAAELMESNPIRVLVLDQRMPRTSGTQLYQQLKALNEHVRAIMLTAEANEAEVGEALNLGFNRWVPKGDLDRLAKDVILLNVEYETDVTRSALETGAEVVRLRRRLWPFGKRSLKYQVVSVTTMADEFVIPGSWETFRQITAGEEVKETIEYSTKKRVTIERASKEEMASSLHLEASHLAKLVASIEHKFSEEQRESHELESAWTATREVSFRLPQEPADPDMKSIRTRNYQRAPVYRRVRALIRTTYANGRAPSTCPVIILIPLPKVTTRHEDHLSDGTTRTVATGETPVFD